MSREKKLYEALLHNYTKYFSGQSKSNSKSMFKWLVFSSLQFLTFGPVKSFAQQDIINIIIINIINNVIDIININLKRALKIIEAVCDNSLKYLRQCYVYLRYLDLLCWFQICLNADENTDKAWVQCCRCSRWFHCSCVGIKLEDAKENDFFCS